MVINNEGIPLKTTLDNSTTVQVPITTRQFRYITPHQFRYPSLPDSSGTALPTSSGTALPTSSGTHHYPTVQVHYSPPLQVLNHNLTVQVAITTRQFRYPSLPDSSGSHHYPTVQVHITTRQFRYITSHHFRCSITT
jgi:hypothetical protein